MVKTALLTCSALLLFVPLLSWATDRKPWFGNEYETEWQLSLLYQNYTTLATADRSRCKRDENDTFLTLGATYPFKRYSGEFEITGANTRHQKHRVDNLRLTGRYQWMNDIDEPLSMVTSITVGQSYTRAVHDISSFHHGRIEGEACFSYGKKYGYPGSNKFLFRWWNILTIGQAEQGRPWLRGDAACEYNYGDVHQFRGFVNTLWGMGNKKLHPNCFDGYGNIKHQSVDLGIRYGYTIGRWGTLNMEYARRIYARNFPKNSNLVLLKYYLPFGTQVSCNY